MYVALPTCFAIEQLGRGASSSRLLAYSQFIVVTKIKVYFEQG